MEMVFRSWHACFEGVLVEPDCDVPSLADMDKHFAKNFTYGSPYCWFS